jgi:hypothetical protein
MPKKQRNPKPKGSKKKRDMLKRPRRQAPPSDSK